jgi:hypothetical protein
MKAGLTIWEKGARVVAVLVLLCLPFALIHAQKPPASPPKPVRQLKVVDNVMYIFISRKLPPDLLNSFAVQYNVSGIGLHQLIGTGKSDSLKEAGWKVDAGNPDQYTISKKLGSAGQIRNPGDKLIYWAVPTPDDWRVVGGNRVVYGVNRFEQDREFNREGDVVIFTLKGHKRADSVRLAGNFTNWQYNAFPMIKTAAGWEVRVKLQPGQYFYKFIVNQSDWMTDPDNQLSENDGRGNENSVFYVYNKKIELKGYQSAHDVRLIGSFNNWSKKAENGLQMKKMPGGWYINLYLDQGTHSYEFMVDGMRVKGNEDAAVSMGEKYLFTLKGFRNAKKVALAGNFNDWEPEQLLMKKTADGWELPYALGPGNYQYKFIVDGEWMTDPRRQEAIVDDGKGNENTLLIIGANHTFKLKGFASSKTINLAGDFTDWSQRGLPMIWNGTEWTASVYLARGKHFYRFIADKKWIRDPANKLWDENEFGDVYSIIWVE